MSKKIQCKKAGKRAQFRTSSKFRQKAFQHKRQIIGQNNCGFATAKKVVVCVAALVVMSAAFFIFGNLAYAQEKSWHFEKWLVDIQINQDSTFLVRETQTVNFQGNFHWLKRDIAKKDLRQISDVKVFDEAGRQLTSDEIEIKDQASQKSIQINFDLTDTTKTWTFEYLVHGGLRFFKDHDELYWNAVSSARDVVIDEVEVLARLSQAIDQNQAKQSIFTGSNSLIPKEFLSPEMIARSVNYEFLPDKQTFRYWGEQIGPWAEFTILAGWPKGVIKPSLIEKYLFFVNRFWLWFLIPVGVFIWFLGLWWHQGRDPNIRQTLIAQYEPPMDLRPAEIAVLWQQRLRPKDLSAMLINLACRGYLKIEETIQPERFLDKKDYFLIKQRDFKTDKELKEFERYFLSRIFMIGDKVPISYLRSGFGYQLRTIERKVGLSLVAAGLFRNSPDFVRKTYLISASVLATMGYILACYLFSLSEIYVIIAFWLTAAILVIFSRVMPAKTKQGAEICWQALGFREYLQVAEKLRLRNLTIEDFTKFLAYAMVFGIEKQWGNRFDFSEKQAQPPDWYVMHSANPLLSSFDIGTFSQQITDVAHSFSQILQGAGRAGGFGGGSGFGGGGGAGGGGGGGGSSAG